MFLRIMELQTLLIKSSVLGGKECQLRLATVGTYSHRFAGPADMLAASHIAVSHGSLDFPSAICQKAGSPRISLPLSPSRARTPSPFSPSRSCRRVLLPREMCRFKRTRRALLCQRPNRKSQLLRASPFLRALCLFLRFPWKCFSTAMLFDVAVLPLFLLGFLPASTKDHYRSSDIARHP